MAQDKKLITIFGGTGFVGSALTKELLKRGYQLRIVSRSAFDQAESANEQDKSIEFISGNIMHEQTISNAVEGADFVVNLVAILFETSKQKFEDLHHIAANNIAKAAKEHDAALVHISSIGANETAQSQYAKTKFSGEMAVREHLPQAVILQPSIIFGPDDAFFNRFAQMAKFSPVLPLIGAQTKFQPIYVGDVAKAIANVIEGKAKPATTYEIGGPEAKTFKDLMKQMMGVTGVVRPIVNLPFPLAKIQGKMMGLLPNPPLTYDQVISLLSDNIVSAAANINDLNLQGLGVAPTSLAEILPQYLAKNPQSD